MSEQLLQQIEALTTRLEQYESEMVEWRKVNLSRVGPVGPRGERGIPGVNARESTTPGPEGRPGKDADISQCVSAAKSAFASEIAKLHASLGSVVVQALKDAGVIDADGRAILVPGPAGRDGQGRDGVDGQSIVGPRGETGAPGRNAQISIGKVSVGNNAAASIRVENGVHYLDVVLPRGEKGDTGAAGKDSTVAGPAGKDSEGFPPSEIARMEAKFRNIWKTDMQIALGAHFRESHAEDIQTAVNNAVEARFAELRAELLAK
jgi:hypothetical protein